jgi:hypothetical protein
VRVQPNVLEPPAAGRALLTRAWSTEAAGVARRAGAAAWERLTESAATVRLTSSAASFASRWSPTERLTTATARSLFSGRTTSRDAHLRGEEHPLVVLVVIVVDAQRGRLAFTHDAKDSTWCLTRGNGIRLHATC